MSNLSRPLAIGFASFFLVSSAFASLPRTSADLTYDDAKTYLQALNAKYPTTTQLITVGASDSGDTILGLRIGTPGALAGTESANNNLVVATHHGNEYGSTEVAKSFAESIAESPIQGQIDFVVPVLNISGYNAKNREETLNDTTVDPNRDYPGPCVTDTPFTLKSTAALAQFIDQNNIVASATLHTFYPAVVYPWGVSSSDLSTPYDDLFKSLVQAATVESGYQTGNSTQVIYPADGTYEDYAFWKHGIWSILFELGDTHTPDESQVAQLEQVNVPGLRNMLEKAPHARAQDHAFQGQCDSSSFSHFDRHDE
jgi:carboxypeptidase T